jgi:uncharacterized protein YdeI (YjbR/CyaY-like superfamily)
MKTRDPRIDAYISDAAEFAGPILLHLRTLVHEACPEATETMKWSFPHFEYADKTLCSMAAFKAHCTFGFWHQGMEKFMADDSGKAESAMGHFGRITSVDDLPDNKTLSRYIRHAMTLNESGTRARPLAKARKALPVPPDLATALKKNKTAAKAFEAFSPSHRREYIEWIVDAKRAETRAKRLATTLEWLTEGKARNWKYQDC